MLRTHVFAIIVAPALCLSCQSTFEPVAVAGTYGLSSTTGTIGRLETPVAGVLVLSPDGAALRRVSYYRDSTSAVTDVVALGTYRVADSTVYFALRGDSGQSALVWRVTATVGNGGLLRFSYPRPADGTIVETYQRSVCLACLQATP